MKRKYAVQHIDWEFIWFISSLRQWFRLPLSSINIWQVSFSFSIASASVATGILSHWCTLDKRGEWWQNKERNAHFTLMRLLLTRKKSISHFRTTVGQQQKEIISQGNTNRWTHWWTQQLNDFQSSWVSECASALAWIQYVKIKSQNCVIKALQNKKA